VSPSGAPGNPYAPPTAAVADAPAALSPDVEPLRRDHVRHERALRAIGSLYWLSALAMGLVTIVAVSFGSLDHPSVGVTRIVMLLFYGGLTLGLGTVAYGLSSLRWWVRIPAIALSAVGLLAIPLGTLINGYALYLLLSAKGATILSRGYAEVIAATPQVRFKRTTGDWIAVGVLVLIVAGFFIFAVTRG
jgi:hypothetical protein